MAIPEFAPFASHEDPYLHWERHLTLDRAGEVWLNPTLVTLKFKENETSEQGFEDTFAQLRKLDTRSWFIDPHEIELLEMAKPLALRGHDIQAILYLLETADTVDENELFTEIRRGPPIRLSSIESSFRSAPLSAPKTKSLELGRVIGVIDDGIGFLNDRFRAETGETRFLGVWLQSFNQEKRTGDSVYSGLQLDSPGIQGKLAQGSDVLTYRKINREIYGPTDLKSLDMNVSHGTHVLDIAAGENPKDVAKVDTHPRILGVQLPPASILDTSGKRMEINVVQGLRWMIYNALLYASAEGLARLKLVVNISLGAAAGSKDGNSFFEAALRAQIKFFEALSTELGFLGSSMHLVLAYGNGYRANLVAFKQLERKEPFLVSWVLQPDDKTASYLEIRCDSDNLCDIAVQVPSEDVFTKFDKPGNGQYQDLEAMRLYRDQDEKDGRACYVLTTPPTYKHSQSSLAIAPGAYEIRIQANEGPTFVSLQVQRDDTPLNYRPHGRQSYLDHPLARQFDPETRNLSKPHPDCPVTRMGNHSSSATNDEAKLFSDDKMFSVGASYHWNDNIPGSPKLAEYSGAGSTDSFLSTSVAPDLCAVSEMSPGLPGILATGTCTGSAAMLGGTSVAAPQVARALMGPGFTGLNTEKEGSAEDALRRGAGVLPFTGLGRKLRL